MQIQKKKGKLKATDSIERIINANRDIKDYFSRRNQEKDCLELALELLRQAIAARNAKSKDKHYNVAYIKHNRFLSPSQKQAVTPKVTQIIPVSPQRVLIFGKPKAKHESQLCCGQPNDRECPEVNDKPKSTRRVEIVSTQGRNPEICSKKSIQTQTDKPEEQERYLSPKAPTKVKKTNPKTTHKIASEKPKEIHPKNQIKSPNSHKGYNLNIESNCRTVPFESERRVTLPSPKHSIPIERYDNVQSKIKFLIERDKRNKKMSKHLQQQTRKIDEMEERQQKLLIRQYEQDKDVSRQQKYTQRIEVSSSESSDDEISSKLKLLKQRISNADEEFYSRAIKPQQKLHRIPTQPLQPLSSSNSSLSDTPSEDNFDF